ncbi:MAG: hypothetical protein GY820_26780 [Gammaproteobacteria bacterium]|nr:hypothetical protein [Gammaproteobacteria bacterium]
MKCGDGHDPKFSGSGKTELLKRLLRPQTFQRLHGCRIGKLVLVYSCWQASYREIHDLLPRKVPVLFFKGISNEVFSEKTLLAEEEGTTTVLVLDDVLQDVLSRKFEQQLIRLASVRVHHSHVTLFLILQLASFKTPEALNVIWNNCRFIHLPLVNSKVAPNLSQNIQV